MSLKSILKALRRAAPAILANAPAVIAAAREVTKAVKAGKAVDTEPQIRNRLQPPPHLPT